MVIAPGNNVPDNDGRASGWIYHVIMIRIQEQVISDKGRRCALAPQIDVVIVTVLIRKEAVLNQYV